MTDPRTDLPPLDRHVLERLPVFPLPNTVFFPGTELPLHVFEPRYRELVRYVLERDRAIGVPLLKPGYEADYQDRPAIHEVMGAGVVVEAEELPDGRWNILVVGTDRVRAVRELPPDHGFRLFKTERLEDRAATPDAVEYQTLRSLALRLADAVPDVRQPLWRLIHRVHGGVELADQLACRVIPDPERRQRILEEDDGARRLSMVTSEIAEVCLRVDPAYKHGSLN